MALCKGEGSPDGQVSRQIQAEIEVHPDLSSEYTPMSLENAAPSRQGINSPAPQASARRLDVNALAPLVATSLPSRKSISSTMCEVWDPEAERFMGRTVYLRKADPYIPQDNAIFKALSRFEFLELKASPYVSGHLLIKIAVEPENTGEKVSPNPGPRFRDQDIRFRSNEQD